MRGHSARRRSCCKGSASPSTSMRRSRRCRSPTSRWSRSPAPWCTMSSLLVLDEPTAVIAGREVALLFDLLRRLREAGVSVLFISHRLDEVFAICDRVTVLKDGRLVGTQEHQGRHAGASDLDDGRARPRRSLPAAADRSAERRARAAHRRRRGWRTGADVSIELRAGEIVALAGMVGAGRSELALGLFGALPLRSGHCSSRRRAVHVDVAGAGDPARHGPRHRGSQVAGAGDAARYRGEHLRARTVRGGAARLDRPAAGSRDRRARDRALPHRLPRPDDRGRDHVRRQPAEGDCRALGPDLPERADPGRTDPRHRCRRQGGDLPHHAGTCRIGRRDPDDQLGADGGDRHGRPRHRHARGPRDRRTRWQATRRRKTSCIWRPASARHDRGNRRFAGRCRGGSATMRASPACSS